MHISPALYITDEKPDIGLHSNFWIYPIVGELLKPGDVKEFSLHKSASVSYATDENPCDPGGTIEAHLDCLVDNLKQDLMHANCSLSKKQDFVSLSCAKLDLHVRMQPPFHYGQSKIMVYFDISSIYI